MAKIKNWYNTNRQELIKTIKQNKLYGVCELNTTYNSLYVKWYKKSVNGMVLLAFNKSSVIGMDRRFDCYCDLLNEYNINMDIVGQKYTFLN